MKRRSMEILAGIAVLILIGLGVVAMVRWSTGAQQALNERVAESDRALQRLADASGLSFHAGSSAPHPTAGRVLGFGSVDGVHRGLQVKVHVPWKSFDPVDFYTELRVSGPSGRVAKERSVTLVRRLQSRWEAGLSDPELFARHFRGPGSESLDADVQSRLLDLAERADELEFDGAALRLVPSGERFGSWISASYSFNLVLDGEALLGALERSCDVYALLRDASDATDQVH